MTYVLLVSTAFGAQALMFVPIVPLLVATGALAAHGELSLSLALLALTLGVAAGDFFWFAVGRRRGQAVLGRLCRKAMEPSTCLRRTENLFGRYGAATLLFAKFIPGLSTVALPLAGVFRMRPGRFLAHDFPGVLLWVGTYVAAGYVSSGALAAATALMAWPTWTIAALAGGGAFLAWKEFRRRMVIRQLRIERIDVHELHARLGRGERLAVIDLRHPLDFEIDPYVIPGAVYIPAEQLAARQHDIPRDREVVVYCTCPDEVTSAREALRLRRLGITHVRPLQGGFSAWRAAKLPVEQHGPLVPDDQRTLNAA